MASESSLSKELIDMKTHSNQRVSVLKPYLFVLVCLLVELHWKLKVCCPYLFIFFKIGASKLGCCLYVDFYGILVLRDAFLERKTKAFI